MEQSKQFLKDNDIPIRISFKDDKPHTVEMIRDKIDSITQEGEEINGVRYQVKEDGEVKSFFTSSASLIATLSQINPGDTITIQMKKRKNEAGQWISYFETKAPNGNNQEEEIPIIEDDEISDASL